VLQIPNSFLPSLPQKSEECPEKKGEKYTYKREIWDHVQRRRREDLHLARKFHSSEDDSSKPV
jgi:hypothetical protein